MFELANTVLMGPYPTHQLTPIKKKVLESIRSLQTVLTSGQGVFEAQDSLGCKPSSSFSKCQSEQYNFCCASLEIVEAETYLKSTALH